MLKKMNQQNFKLKEGQEYIELIKLLQVCHLAQSGGHAKILIENGEVLVNGEVEFRKRNKIRDGFMVLCGDHEIMVNE
jgi:ribosome-associated protein